MHTDYVIVLTTLPAAHDAAALARELVEARVAACVNILPEMRSIYRWQGKVEEEAERQILIKTGRGRVRELWERLRARHPYEVPEFLVLPIADGHEAYLRWIAEGVGEA